jgi:hypothetical protein
MTIQDLPKESSPMKKKLTTMTAVLACAGLSAAAIVPAIASAAVPGDNCQVNSGRAWQVLVDGATVAYTVSYPSHVVIDAYAGPDTYWAHGNGQASGIMVRAAVNQSTCS